MRLLGNNPSLDRLSSDYLWCPWAEIGLTKMKVRGKYKKGFPQGAIVHYTAGRDYSESDAVNTLKWSTEQGYCFFVIGPTGIVYQSFPLSHWGYHAGKSNYKGLGDGVSQFLVGIEVVNAGSVKPIDDKYAAWFHMTDGYNPKNGIKKSSQLFYNDEVRSVEVDHLTYVQKGVYRKFTPHQEQSLTQLILWMKRIRPDVFNLDFVLGHSEVSPFRKIDPGGSISMSMSDYRNYLKGF